jgi:hypothetical protein
MVTEVKLALSMSSATSCAVMGKYQFDLAEMSTKEFELPVFPVPTIIPTFPFHWWDDL